MKLCSATLQVKMRKRQSGVLNNALLAYLVCFIICFQTKNTRATTPTTTKAPHQEHRSPEAFGIQKEQSVSRRSVALPPGGHASKRSLRRAITKGILLSFNSGFINGCCLSGWITGDGTRQGVAAVTGAYTTSALGLAGGNLKQAFSHLSVVASYVTGSAVSGLVQPNPVAFEVTASHSFCFYIGAVLLFYATILAQQTDTKGAPRASFCLAAAANGIQNSLSSTYSGNLCRTTHLTGMSSDIGTYMGQCLRGNTANLFRLQVFGALALSFWTGGFVSFAVAKRYASSSLLFSAVLYVILGTGLIDAAPLLALRQSS